MRPMLATAGPLGSPGRPPAIPSGPHWSHEVKWDGIRLVVQVHDGNVRAFTRSERDVSIAFPELAGLAGLGNDLVLDTEAVSLSSGSPRFSEMIERMHCTDPRRSAELARSLPVTLMAFDLVRFDGLDLAPLPWTDRRAALESVVGQGPRWQVPPTFTDGTQLWRATRDQGLEGVVSKHRSSRYQPGVRSTDWIKFPHRTTGSYLVGGWRAETGSRRLGSLLLGEPTGQGLAFVGRVGSGLAGRAGQRVERALAEQQRPDSPFDEPLTGADLLGVTWVQPLLVVEVASLGRTSAARLRQPSFQGIRLDLDPRDLTPPAAVAPREDDRAR